MAIPTNIKTLLSGTVIEQARIEYKETWDAVASLKTICAFANDLDNWGGGYIIIGIKDDNGRPHYPLSGVPVEKIDSYQKNMLSACKLLRPKYLPVVDVIDYEDVKLIVIWCPGGNDRPYSSPKTMAKNNKEKIHYIRKNSSSIEPSDDDIKELYSLSARIPFDDRIRHEADMDDLSITLIQNYLKEIKSSLYEESKDPKKSFIELCSDMKIISELPEYAKPKNIGLMMFCFEPQKYFPYAQIDVVHFPEGAGGDNIIERIFTGPLHIQLKEALLYIKNSTITERVIKYPDRPEADRFYNYPLAAIEEGLANAVYHRSYEEREPIEVRIEVDTIEIISHPGPDRSVTLKGLKEYKVQNRKYRNRRIGDFLKELHMTEGRNTGFRKILRALENNGSPLPEFETDENHDYFITRFFIHERFKELENNQNDRQDDFQGVPQDVLQAKLQKEKIADEILHLLSKNNKITRLEIANIVGVSEKTIARYIKKMANVKYIGSGYSGHWEIIEDDSLR